MQMSLLDIAVKKSGETPEHNDSEKRTLVFAGSKASGKTSMIQRFLEKTDPVKETLALEYSFGRKSGRSLNKDLCHVWELGGGVLFAPLLSNVFGPNVRDVTLVLVLDLSSPQTLWLTLETILQAVFNYVHQPGSDLEKIAADRVPSDHQDKDGISPFPIPLLLIGSKYDQFQNFDPEKKKLVCRTLRLVAHSLAASLFFYSDKDPNLVKKLKDLLNQYGFGGAASKGFNVDINKPLAIPFGADSFEQIGGMTAPARASGGLALERFKHMFTEQFPQEKETTVIPDDPAKDPNFKEPAIDQLRMHRDEELDRFLREQENKLKVEITSK